MAAAASAATGLNPELRAELELLRKNEADLGKLIMSQTQLTSSLEENRAVKEELAALGPEERVYKASGPVLVKQDIDEARDNVDKRIDLITRELADAETRIKALQEAVDAQKDKIIAMQRRMAAEGTAIGGAAATGAGRA